MAFFFSLNSSLNERATIDSLLKNYYFFKLSYCSNAGPIKTFKDVLKSQVVVSFEARCEDEGSRCEMQAATSEASSKKKGPCFA